MSQYRCLRNEQMQLVVDSLQRHHLIDALRGSWKHDDFHLSSTGILTHSDLDLVVEGLSPMERLQTQATFQSDFGNSMGLLISVHGSDSLLNMNLADSFILNIGEFISKARRLKVGDPVYDYTLAKITLLLLRSFPEERYSAVAIRIGTPEARFALDVKLGLESVFPSKKAEILLRSSPQPLAREFVEECILKVPTSAFKSTIRNRVRCCKSIDPWLQKYLISKMNVGVT